MPDSESPSERERRQSQRRAKLERRFGERRQPERAVAGRRIVFANDRRTAERRVAQNLSFQSA